MSLAGLIFWDVKFKAPKDNAAARVEEVEENVEDGGDATVGEVGGNAFLEGWRLSCRAFARAFSCVRTKLARFYRKHQQHLLAWPPDRK